jgi:hypothetical protein
MNALSIYAFAIEHPEGVIVVDTGETARTSETDYFPSWHPYFRYGLREWVAPEDEIGPQLQRLGIAAACTTSPTTRSSFRAVTGSSPPAAGGACAATRTSISRAGSTRR